MTIDTAEVDRTGVRKSVSSSILTLSHEKCISKPQSSIPPV